MQQEVSSALRKIPFLLTLPENKVVELAVMAKKKSFPKHSIIISEGDESNSLYILLTGKVRVFTSDNNGKEVTLLVQKPISYFGELALLSKEPRSASVLSLENCQCAVIARSDFNLWLTSHPEVARCLIEDLTSTIRRLTTKVKLMALSNVYERTTQALMDMAYQEGDIFVISSKPTQQELANLVGASREMVNKIMKELSKGGYIEMEDKSMKIMRKLPNSW